MDLLAFLFETLLGEFVVVIVGVLFATYIKSYVDELRFGGWRVVVRGGEITHVNRAISSRKAKEVLDEPVDLAVFVKGVASPYAFLNCDPIEKGQEIGLLVIDREQRRFLIDLDRNPPGRLLPGPHPPT